MKIRKLLFTGISLAVLSTALLVSSCTKDENTIVDEKLALDNSEQVDEYVPFFELEKGECIDKGICREKPDFKGKEDVVLLFSTESTLKSGSEIEAISDFRAEIKSTKGAPTYLGYNLVADLDLNEGAGGKYIYLYFKRDDLNPICNINVRSSKYSWWLMTSKDGNEYPTTKFGGGAADLNDGAGGRYIYLTYKPGTDGGPIKQVSLAAGTTSNFEHPDGSNSGWIKDDTDLNEGAGGKYIYLFYKH